jgi:hypothetical protein
MREIRSPGMRAAILTTCVFAALSSARVAHATELVARVVIKGALPAAPEPLSKRARFHWILDNGVLGARANRLFPERDLAIVLVERGRPAARRTAEPVTIRLADGGMSPIAVVVRPRTMVRFQNDDAFAHELYAPNRDDFTPETTARGQSRPFVAPSSGQVEIRCKRAPHMRGFIAVTDAAHVITPGPEGTFTRAVEPGLYTVRTYFEGRWLPESELLVEDTRSQNAEIVIDATTARPQPPPASPVPANPSPAPVPTPPSR